MPHMDAGKYGFIHQWSVPAELTVKCDTREHLYFAPHRDLLVKILSAKIFHFYFVSENDTQALLTTSDLYFTAKHLCKHLCKKRPNG